MQRNQHDRIIFNGHDLSRLVYCKVHRPIMADVSATFESVPGRHGEVFKSAFRAGYDLPVEVWLRSEDRRRVSDVRHKLASALWSDEPAPLYLPDDPTRYLMAIVTGATDLDEITDDCPTTIVTFHIGDPDFYGQKRRVEVSAGNVFINVGGNRPAHLHVTARPEAGKPWRITNVDTGEFVAVTGQLAQSSVIRIDMEQERATVNSQTAPVSIDSDYFEINGRCHLNITGGTAVLEWRERWL
ncbi:MAG: phage tail family protein [Coriobacteriaceae bacterium]|nr:phage tail family protein [Coriobacteriaceae bacterium]